MSQLACNIALYRPDPLLLAEKYRIWHLEALLHQADALITRCMSEFAAYSSLDHAWNQFEIDLETQENKLGLYNRPAKDVFDRDIISADEEAGLPEGAQASPEEPEIMTLVEPVEEEQAGTAPEEGAGIKSSLDFRVEAVQRKKELSGPGKPFALNEQRDQALKRLCRDYEEAVDRACVAAEGLKTLYDHIGPSSPVPAQDETLGASITTISIWIRNSLEWLAGYHLREQAFTRVVSVRSLMNRNAWALVKHSRESYSTRLQVPADLFRGHDNCHLRGLGAALVGEAGTVPWAIVLRLPEEAAYERSGRSLELDQSDRPACLLGRVESRRSYHLPATCGATTLLNASPIGRSTPGGLWSLDIIKPAGASSESFGHLEDVILEIHAVGIPGKITS